ncbi:MAG: AlpA family phage regulatory protein [Alphaproteobacteria bacterium]|nr:AlpA family phage regulatory protein [Alphaproteobacteria bacterium]
MQSFSETGHMKSLPRTGYIRQSELLDALPFSASTLWRMVRTGKFPKHIKLSARVTAWRIEEVHAWLKELHNTQKSA